MDELKNSLLTMLQKKFPLTARPFESMGLELGICEEDCLAWVGELKKSGLIRQISAIFDSRGLGYQSALIACKVDPKKLEQAALLISSQPGVSHNYQRESDYNLWFTLALAPHLDFAAEAARLAHRAGCERWLILPSLRTFKIEVALDAGQGAAESLEKAEPQAAPHPALSAPASPVWLSEQDKNLVRLLQEDIELVPRPFLRMAQGLGWSETEVFDWMAEAGRSGILRRFAAILRHRKAGFSANGMGVWRVPTERVEEVGKILASYRAVSHCYERPMGPDWPYNLFSMVHAKTPVEAKAIFDELSRATGIADSDYRVLYSSVEFKKERVKYFLEDAPGPLWRPLTSA